jgi:two-component system, NtrC family, response regulator HydG
MTKHLRILLTDDNTEFSLNLKDILEIKGYEVFIANDGFSALEFVRHNPVDLVLMDIKMPVMNGVETFKKLKAIVPGIPVIMLTGFAVEELIQESLRNGVYGCLHKPLDFEELFTTIESAVPDSCMILVVDDDKELCENMRDILQQHGYRVSFALDGNEALDKTRKNNYDVLLLDMKLPPVNGLDTFLSIRRIRPDVETIIITGKSQEMGSMIKEALEKKAFGYMEKPIGIDPLLTLIKKIEKQKLENKTTGS